MRPRTATVGRLAGGRADRDAAHDRQGGDDDRRPAEAWGDRCRRTDLDRTGRRGHREAALAHRALADSIGSPIGSGCAGTSVASARRGTQRSIRRPVARFQAASSEATLTSRKKAGSAARRCRPIRDCGAARPTLPSEATVRPPSVTSRYRRPSLQSSGRACHDRQEREGHHPAEDLVRGELDRIETGPAGIEQVPAEGDAAQATGHDPDLPTVLEAVRRGDRLPGDRVGCEHEPATRGDDGGRGEEVIGHARPDRLEQAPGGWRRSRRSRRRCFRPRSRRASRGGRSPSSSARPPHRPPRRGR